MIGREEAQALLDGMTLGPWEAIPMVPKANNAFYIEGNRDQHNHTKDVATVGPCLAPSTAPNARAIAALPDILKALIASIEREERLTEELERVGYHVEQARTYISQPPSATSEKHMTSARWHLDKARATLKENARVG